MDIVERLVAFKDYTGLTNSQFADKARIHRSTLSQFLNGRNKRLSDDFTAKLHLAYPELNVLWLLFGEGEMVTVPNIEISEGKNEDSQADLFNQPTENKEYNLGTTSSEAARDFQTIRENGPSEMPFDPRLATKAGEEDPSPYFCITREGRLVDKSLPSAAETPKRIQSIMVFYSDNSYELFTPAGDDK